MKSKHAWLCLPLFLAPFSLQAQGPQSQTPAEAVFDDSLTKRIRSDGQSGLYGNYPHLVNCVRDRVNQGGLYFLRTGYHTCVPAFQRKIKVDFSTPVLPGPTDCSVDDAFGQDGELNICGSNTLPDLRIIADTMFSNTALASGTPVTLYFSLIPDSSNQAFKLEFEQNVGVTAGANSNIRILEAGSGAVAEAYKNVPPNQKVSLGRFYMPFKITVTKIP